ncbi:MAG: nuclear transport factor 2 family protein [Thermoleophilaceae bacterium]
MSQENVEIVRLLLGSGADLQALLSSSTDLSELPWLSLWHPECVIEEVAEVPDAATYRGREGVLVYLRQFAEPFDEVRYVPVELVDCGDRVLATTDISGRSKAGVDVHARVFQAYRLQDGMVIHVTGYLDRSEALKAVGLEE